MGPIWIFSPPGEPPDHPEPDHGPEKVTGTDRKEFGGEYYYPRSHDPRSHDPFEPKDEKPPRRVGGEPDTA